MKKQSYNNFWYRIHKSAKNKGFPLRVMFELTYRCNFFCPHCYVPLSYRKYKELKTKEIFFILDQLADIGCFYLGFTGGEPFMRKDIMKILWYAKRRGFEVIIYTNSSLIDERLADELSYLRPNKVDITTPAISKDTFERITGVSGSRDKVFKAIDLLYKKGVNLGFKTCVLKENENEIQDIQGFAASLGALHRLDDMLSRRLDGSEEPYKYRGRLKENLVTHHTSHVTSKEEFKDCNLEAEQREPDSENRTARTDNLFKCGVGETQAAITPQGELKMCLMIDYPKYRILSRHVVTSHQSPVASPRTDVKNAWERLKEAVASIKLDENYRCDKCGLNPYCKWCPAKSWLQNKSFTSCDPESQRWAELRMRRFKMPKKPKFRPRITRIKLNPEQAVLTCSCYSVGKRYGAVGDLNPPLTCQILPNGTKLLQPGNWFDGSTIS